MTLMQNRRSFITTFISTVLASRLAPVRAADLDSLSPIEEIMHDFVMRRMMDDDGLCRSFLCAATLAAWTNEDLAKTDQRRITDMFQNSPDKAGCLSYENALMATGEFALSQIIRHRVLKDNAALELAHRGIKGILAVIEEGRHYMPGWLPKPLRGLRHARDSHEMSVDQYTKAIVALHAWRPLAGQDEQAVIDRFFIDATDFFIARKWRHAYRHRTIVTAATHHHALGLYVALPQLAAQASGDERYLAQLPQFDDAITAALANDRLESGFNGISLIVEGFHTAMQAGSRDKRLPQLIEHLWKSGARCVDEQGRGFIPSQPPVFDSQGPRLAAVAPMVETLNPATRATELACKILNAHRDPSQMRHVGNLSESIAEVSITSWLVAYWRLREATRI
jgi:hypothetical protein